MGLPTLLGCVSLWAGLVLAEVGSFSRCQQYFYKGVEPEGFNTQRTAKICQRYNGTYHYATLYDRDHRIPRWSAYTLNETACEGQPQRRSRWFVEPQLFGADKGSDMTTEAESGLTPEDLRFSQAVSEDYEDTSYDPGPLNPNGLQCNSNHTAIFTLTNTIPMKPCFLWSRWHKLQHLFQAELAKSCLSLGGVAYLVTGSGPNREMISRGGEDQERDQAQLCHRVSVPSHVWMAACCDNRNTDHKFSLAFLAENKEESRLQILPVTQLNGELLVLNQTLQRLRIFADNCSGESQRSQEALSALRASVYIAFQDRVLDSYFQFLPPEERQKLDKRTNWVMKSRNVDLSEVRFTAVRAFVEVSSSEAWQRKFTAMYNQDNLACVLSSAPSASGLAQTPGTSRKVCILQEQKHQPDSDVTAWGWHCIGHACGKHKGTAYSWCYTSKSYYWNYWDYCCTEKCTSQYECARGDGGTAYCSPQYSTVTVTGQLCRADFPCGLYGERYFWCYTDYRQNWNYCCSPHHYCGHHGYSYQWCYVGGWRWTWKYCVP
ncbi:endonuclease domain-containing 1 protein [Alligator mississippiensis]|uniref:endonuclease domain-containing 1 protein n=1 Tax=Alligator mississippiensis TaxID=8496 RepID=UPI0003D097C5|nr:endonuclease domain-containing 1 protein [Alligator mississippiensis]